MAVQMRPMPVSSSFDSCSLRPGYLLAVLLNPPSTTTGSRSLGAVDRAAKVLGFEHHEVANLFSVPTPTVVELNLLTIDDASWGDIQLRLREHTWSAGGVLAAWGIAGASGMFRRERDKRGAWLYQEALKAGHEGIWTVGGEPRHPSRWHQYVADKYARTAGGTFEQRLSQVLTLTALR